MNDSVGLDQTISRMQAISQFSDRTTSQCSLMEVALLLFWMLGCQAVGAGPAVPAQESDPRPKLTGIVHLHGWSMAFLEVPSSLGRPQKPILQEGERTETVEVRRIDESTARVSIYYQGKPMSLRMPQDEALFFLDGFAFVRGGDRFVMVVPKGKEDGLPKWDEEAFQRKAQAAPPAAPARLELVNVNRAKILETYAAYSGREALPPPEVPRRERISVQSQQALTPGEILYALEAVAALNGFGFASIGEDKIQIVPAKSMVESGPRPRGLPPSSSRRSRSRD